ncbi:MAG: NAD(P)-binding domain-containing protein [Hyphomicrobium sp.]|nr:NAD(P)-binding domain-containing protein [Hyphomicrobium sp.]
MSLDPVIAFYAAPLVAIWSVYLIKRRRTEFRSLNAREEAIAAGLSEPTSLHPVIDSALCVGCKACLNACPEGDILGLIRGKAELVEPSNCIGHGACKTACPRGAISLVFGSEKRGVDLPVVGPDFATNVPGIYIAGELGGMGLIRNAVEQGRQAMQSIVAQGKAKRPGMLDVVIVGSGPAGIAASLGAMEKRLQFVTLEQDAFGGTVAHFPRGKIVMTAPAELPIVGQMKFKEVSKEKLLAFWHKVMRDTGLKINDQERVESVTAIDGGYAIKTTRAQYQTQSVLLAIGRRGTPRRLGAPGEELPKVVYRMVDPEQYRGQHVLVVGGGDSALEAASSLADEPGTTVTLSYRSDAFARAKTKNRKRVEDAELEGRINVLLSSTVSAIHPDHVELKHRNAPVVLRNDAIIVCAGGILPTDFLKSMGITIETKHGTA